MMPTAFPTCRRAPFLVLLAILATAPSARALPAHLAAAERHLDKFLAKSLRNCTLCHLPSDKKDPESLEEFPHNPFGAAVMKAGKQLRADGKKREIAARLDLVAALDSDNDGVPNLDELLLGHNPGDAKDKPSSNALKTLPDRREAFAGFLKSYRWQPFEPVVRPAVPTPTPPIASANPIDAFIAEQYASRGLAASPPAPKHVLLRRVYLDLVGLNPSPEEIAAFDADHSPDAYEKVVDKLLASPLYGQRWARHWMDVWRYSDWAGWTGGNQIRDSQPHIWRWRDWIVESLNADKGYDRMVLEMIAGDEVAPTDPATLRATGFLVRNYKMLSREQWLEDTVNHTTRAFLGLTMHCAKCHDHKFDPIAQTEYYQMRAVFEPHDVRIDPVPGAPDKKKDGLCRAYDKTTKSQTLFFIRGDERTPDKDRGPMQPGVPAALGGSLEIKPVLLPREAAHPDRVEFMRDAIRAEAKATYDAAKAKLKPIVDNAKLPARQRHEAEAALAAAEARHAATLAVLKAEQFEDAGKKETPEWRAAALDAYRAQRTAAAAEAAANLIAAENAAQPAAADKPAPKAALDKVEAAQKALAKSVADLAAPATTGFKSRSTDDYPQESTGRRTAFARWLASPKNPLTARVAVNHLWARHFAQGLVASTDDFGRNGRPPSHPALLDYLASELMANDWRMKPIHRLIVTSAAYRQTSVAAPSRHSELAADPDDTFLWRFPSKRMEAEIVRDNVLWSAGQLDLTAGGPEIDQTLDQKSHRRSLYFRIAPEKEVEFLKVFDGPNPNECYYRRPTVIPQQALALGNSQLAVEQAKLLAAALAKQTANDPESFTKAAFLRILARPATPDEVAACKQFLTTQKSPERARENLCSVLFNHNDFVTIR